MIKMDVRRGPLAVSPGPLQFRLLGRWAAVVALTALLLLGTSGCNSLPTGLMALVQPQDASEGDGGADRTALFGGQATPADTADSDAAEPNRLVSDSEQRSPTAAAETVSNAASSRGLAIGDGVGVDQDAAMGGFGGPTGGGSASADGGFFARLFAPRCDVDTDREGVTCAQQHAEKADACLRDAIELSLAQSHWDSDVRRLLDCAERNYQSALRVSAADKGAPARISYHGGLLMTLSERRNRLDDQARDGELARVNEQLLAAADAARLEAPDDALGFLYGASARLFRATLHQDTDKRCSDLRDAAAMLAKTPAPPAPLGTEEKRLSALATSELARCEVQPQLARTP